MVSSESGVLVSSYLSSDVGADLSWQLLSSYRDMLEDDNKFDVMLSPIVCVFEQMICQEYKVMCIQHGTKDTPPRTKRLLRTISSHIPFPEPYIESGAQVE